MTEKDTEQDQMIRDNAARIARNEEAIKRQTAALEMIRDHYYPPPERKWWKKAATLIAKAACLVFAYLGIAQTLDWIWNARESDSLASRYAEVATRLYKEEGDFRGALACFEKASEIDPSESEYLMTLTFLRGMSLVGDYLDNERPPTDAEQVRIDAALAEAAVENELDPENPTPYVLMAQAYLLSGEREEAVAAVERAVALAPALPSVHVSACAINYFEGRVKEARAHLDAAARLRPTFPLVCVWKGLLAFWVDRDAAKARAVFEELAGRTPRFAVAHLYLGQAILAEANPDFKRARAAFERALVLDAKLTRAMRGMSETYERENRLILARMWLDRALVLDANYLPALVSRARIAVRLGDPAAAVTDLTAAIALVPFRAELYRLRAEACAKAGDAARAKADREAAAALAP